MGNLKDAVVSRSVVFLLTSFQGKNNMETVKRQLRKSFHSCLVDAERALMFFRWFYPKGSIYGIFTYIYSWFLRQIRR